MKIFIRTLIGSCLIFFSTHGLSATDLYQVEVVVFSQISPHGLNQEAWPQTHISPLHLKNTTELLPPNAFIDDTPDTQPTLSELKVLPRTQWTLKQSAQRLENQTQYQVLLHLAWQQQIKNTRHPAIIHLYGGNAYNHAGNAVYFDDSLNTPYTKYSPWQVDGTLKLSLNRYIDEDFNLQFSIPLKTFLSMNTRHDDDLTYHGSFISIPLHQTRRTRSGELNYIDHPLFGILTKVIPIKTTEVTSNDESNTV